MAGTPSLGTTTVGLSAAKSLGSATEGGKAASTQYASPGTGEGAEGLKHGLGKVERLGNLESQSARSLKANAAGVLKTDLAGVLETDSARIREADAARILEADLTGVLKTNPAGILEVDAAWIGEPDAAGVLEADLAGILKTEATRGSKVESTQTAENGVQPRLLGGAELAEQVGAKLRGLRTAHVHGEKLLIESRAVKICNRSSHRIDPPVGPLYPVGS